MKPKLKVKIGTLVLKNPVMVASGTFGTGSEFADFLDVKRLGAVVTKTITRRPRPGNPPPRLFETAAGVLNAVGLQNDGLDAFVSNTLKKCASLKTPLIVSIGGNKTDEYARMVRVLAARREVAAIEVNVSCPNISTHGRMIAQDAKLTGRLVSRLRPLTSLPLIIKLSPNVTDIVKIARAAEEAGADAVSLINTLSGMAIDIHARRPVLGNVIGGLSGPAIKPVALRMVWEVCRNIRLPVIGMGGIMNSFDALEFLMAGATAVAVGTANFVNPAAAIEVLEGITFYLSCHKIKDVNALIGCLKTP